ncbi:MAG: O-antigen ligase family protein [Verrucomicrobium sp.]|nr:O-antigen ligase family protein [Verrucomicrobium sp.]
MERGLLARVVSAVNAFLLFLLIAWPAVAMGGARVWVQAPFFVVAAFLLLLQVPVVWKERRAPLRPPDWIDGFAAAFLLYAIARYFTAPVEYLARLEVMQVASYAAIFWVARYRILRAFDGVWVVGGLVATALGVVLFSFWLRWHPGFLPWGESVALHYFPRLTGTFGCPNHYGAFLYMAVAAALSLALFVPERPLLRLACAGAATLFMAGIALSLSRGSWVGLLFVLLTVTFFALRHARIPAYYPIGFFAAALAVGMAALTASHAAQDRLAEVNYQLHHDGARHYVRIQIAADAVRIIGDYFWFGSGPATFVHIHPRYHDATYDTLATYAHDDYLNLWCDYGAAGFALGLGFVVTATVGLARRRASGGVPWTRRVLVCAGLGAWAGMAVHSFLDFAMHLPACAATLFTLAGLGLRRRPLALDAAPPLTRRGRFLKRLMAAAAVVVPVLLAAGLLFGAWRTARGYYPWQQVEERLSSIPFRPAVALLKQAAQGDPLFSEAPARLGDFYRAEASLHADPAERDVLGREAIEWYQRALDADPLDDGLYLRLGMAYELLGRSGEAYLCYARIAGLQPHNGYFQGALARYYARRGMARQAIEAYRRAAACPFGAPPEAAAMIERLEQKEKAPTP